MLNLVRGRPPLHGPVPDLIKLPTLVRGIQLWGSDVADVVHVEGDGRHVAMTHDRLAENIEAMICRVGMVG